MTSKTMGILLGALLALVLIFGFLFRAEIKEKIDAVSNTVKESINNNENSETVESQSVYSVSTGDLTIEL